MIRIIHLIFIKFTDKTIEDYGYNKNIEIWRKWCDNNNFKLMIHDKESIDKISTDKDLEMIKRAESEKRHKWIALDWGKYKVLDHYGGVYSDMDVYPKNNAIDFFNSDKIASSYYNKNKYVYNNNLIYFEKDILRDCLNYLYNEYEIKSKIEIYDTWKCRFLLQIAGPRGFGRWCKINKIEKRLDFYDYFEDEETKSWNTWKK